MPEFRSLPYGLCGAVFSAKNGRYVRWTREIEKDFMHLLEADPEVLSYRAGPARIAVPGENDPHTISFLAMTRDGAVYVDLADEKFSQNWADAAKAWCHGKGYLYRVVSDDEVLAQPRLSNALTLMRGRGFEPPEEFVLGLQGLLHHGARPLSEIEKLMEGWPSPRIYVFALALRGAVRLDHRLPISGSTLISL